MSDCQATELGRVEAEQEEVEHLQEIAAGDPQDSRDSGPRRSNGNGGHASPADRDWRARHAAQCRYDDVISRRIVIFLLSNRPEAVALKVAAKRH
jgi:hypothetical protein